MRDRQATATRYPGRRLGIGQMQLSPSLHRLGSGIVASYLVADAGGVTIVDAGLPGFWGDLPKELAAMGRSLDDVRGVS